MPKRSCLRVKLLDEKELGEPTTIIGVRVPRSWHTELLKDGSISDKLLAPLAEHIKRIKKKRKPNKAA